MEKCPRGRAFVWSRSAARERRRFISRIIFFGKTFSKSWSKTFFFVFLPSGVAPDLGLPLDIERNKSAYCIRSLTCGLVEISCRQATTYFSSRPFGNALHCGASRKNLRGSHFLASLASNTSKNFTSITKSFAYSQKITSLANSSAYNYANSVRLNGSGSIGVVYFEWPFTIWQFSAAGRRTLFA